MAHSKDPPSLPTVVDEAGETPTWVPVLGLLLFGLLALAAAARLAIKDAEQPTAAPTADAAVPAPTPDNH
jgi:hypothetical protein